MCDVFCTQNKENKHKKTVERREKVKEKVRNGDKTKKRLVTLSQIYCVAIDFSPRGNFRFFSHLKTETKVC